MTCECKNIASAMSAATTDRSVHILTYQVPHRKTYDTLCRLRVSGYRDVYVWAIPLSYRKGFRPLLSHRPDMVHLVPASDAVCEAFGYKYQEVTDYSEVFIPESEPVLVCGAGILPEKFVDSHMVINAHPGYIPLTRGLDALKWAVWEGSPIGVTTHLIGSEVDAGWVIERQIVEVREEDTLLDLGLRVYETEIAMLVGTLDRLGGPFEYIPAGENVVHRRMPHNLERQFAERFSVFKQRYTAFESNLEKSAGGRQLLVAPFARRPRAPLTATTSLGRW